MMPTDDVIGLLAGGGLLPKCIVDTCLDEGKSIFVLVFEGQADQESYKHVPHAVIRLGAAGQSIKLLKQNGCRRIVMAGSINRPTMRQLRPDWWGVKFFAKSGAAALGDDGLLTALIAALETEGFEVFGAEELLPSLLLQLGTPTLTQPDYSEPELKFALQAAKDLGARDIGQAVIVKAGAVIAEEAADGTDAMMNSLAVKGNDGGVLAKALKPMQERRADIPAIGPDTVRNAAKAGLKGIVCEAGGTFLLGRDEAINEANRLGLFITGITLEEDIG